MHDSRAEVDKHPKLGRGVSDGAGDRLPYADFRLHPVRGADVRLEHEGAQVSVADASDCGERLHGPGPFDAAVPHVERLFHEPRVRLPVQDLPDSETGGLSHNERTHVVRRVPQRVQSARGPVLPEPSVQPELQDVGRGGVHGVQRGVRHGPEVQRRAVNRAVHGDERRKVRALRGPRVQAE